MKGLDETIQEIVGQTIQGIDKRISQHKYALKRGDMSSAIFNHWLATRHAIDFDGTISLCHEENLSRRLVKESIHIALQTNPMTRNKSNWSLKLPVSKDLTGIT